MSTVSPEFAASAVRYERRNAIRGMQSEVRQVNEANGWYEIEATFGDRIALLHSEVSEALEAYRDHGTEDRTRIACAHARFMADYDLHDDSARRGAHVCKPEGVGSELADVFIRLLDMCDRYGVDLAAEYERKTAFNRTRGYRHGGKRL